MVIGSSSNHKKNFFSIVLIVILCFSSIPTSVSVSNYKIKWKKLGNIPDQLSSVSIYDMLVSSFGQELILTGYDNDDPLNHHLIIYGIDQGGWSHETTTRITGDVFFLTPQLYDVQFDQTRNKIYKEFRGKIFEILISNDNTFHYNSEPILTIYNYTSNNYMDINFVYNHLEDHLFIQIDPHITDMPSETKFYNLQTQEWNELNSPSSQIINMLGQGDLIYNPTKSEITHFISNYRPPYEILNFTVVFDYSTLKWEKQESSTYPSHIDGMSMVFDGSIDRYVAIGGRFKEDSQFNKGIWVYNYHLREWQVDRVIPESIEFFIQPVYNPVNGIIYILGHDSVESQIALYTIDIHGTGFDEELEIGSGVKIVSFGLIFVVGIIVLGFYSKNKSKN